MDQTSQNDLQQAIDNAANNNTNDIQEQLGVPPMPPKDGAAAPFEGAFPTEMPPVAGVDVIPASEAVSKAAEGGDEPAEAPAAEGPAANEPSAEAILSDTITTPENLPVDDMSATREGILRDLMPLMDKVEGDPERKFDIYKEAMDTLHDKNLVSGAYKEAAKISDENKKADALMTLLNAIDTL